jgi:formylglycine-generating enzyme required for sulfatase activity
MKYRKVIFLILSVCIVHINSIANAKMTIEKVLVEGGTFVKGGRNISINSFYISIYEITNQQYAVFLNDSKISGDGLYHGISLIDISSKDLQIEYKNGQWVTKPGFECHPMVMVNYYGASQFCNWMGGRLPTEDEWIYSSIGGKKNHDFKYAGENELQKIGWFKENSQHQSHAVGKKIANSLGIYDLSGNVWEWCFNDSLKSNQDFCLHKGGSWYAGEQSALIQSYYGNTPTHTSNSVGFRVIFSSYPFQQENNIFLKTYSGKPWKNNYQQIPGKIQAEWFDVGGQGIAYHDQDSNNNGSGKLNPINGTELNAFRMNESVDISYTKSKGIDDNPYNIVNPFMGELYVGWTVPREWINYSVEIVTAGYYSLGLMYTASGNGTISLLLDGKMLTNDVLIPSTKHDQETIQWRQWHHWNKLENICSLYLPQGHHVLTLKTSLNGNLNYDYLELIPMTSKFQ